MRTLFPLIQAKGTFANKLLGTSLESLLNLGLTWKPEVFIYLCFQKLCFWRTHTHLQMILPWFPSLSLPCFSPKDVEYFFCQGTKKRTGYLPFVFQIHSQLFSIVLSTQEMEWWAVWQGSPALWLLVWPTGIPCRDQREEGVSMRSWLSLSELCPLNRSHRSSHKSSFLLHFFTSEKPTQ